MLGNEFDAVQGNPHSHNQFSNGLGVCKLGNEFTAEPSRVFCPRSLAANSAEPPAVVSLASALDVDVPVLINESGVGQSDNNLTLQRFHGHVRNKRVFNYSHLFIFYNICTMYESAKSDMAGMVTGRRLQLDDLFTHLSATVIGLAETRTRAARCRTNNYLCVSGGAEKQNLGCELWIASKYPVQLHNGSIGHVNISQKNIVTVHAEPRILLVCVSVNNQNTFFLVYHAPHEQWGLEVRQKFFLKLAQVASLADLGSLVTLGDANGQVGSSCDSAVGCAGREMESSNGELFRGFLNSIKSFLPCTFNKFVTGNCHTTFQNLKRIDYCSIPIAWKASSPSAGVCPISDTMALEEDHTPVFVKVSLLHSNNCVPWVSRKKSSLAIPDQVSPEDSQSFRRSMLERPHCYAACPNDALNTFQNHFLNIATSLFPKKHNKFVAHVYISDRTRAVAKQKKAAVARLRQVKKQLGITRIPESSHHFHLVLEVRKAVKDMARAVFEDWDEYLGHLADQVVEHDALHRAKSTYSIMRKMQKKPYCPPTLLLDNNDHVAKDPINVRRVLQSRICELTNGQVCTPEELLREYSELPSLADRDHWDLIQQWLPCLESLAGICASIKKDRAGGEADLPGNIVRLFPVQVAYHLLPIVHKIMTTCKEPLFWSGGIAHELLKAGGASARANSYRFVLLADTLGKVYHSYLRQCLVPYINSYMLSTMCGSFLKRGTDFATLLMKSFTNYAQEMKHSWGAIFLDVSAAFESLQHFFIFNQTPTDHQVHAVFSKFGFNENMYAEFVQAVQAKSAFEEAGVPPALANVVAAAHQISWFSTEGLRDIVIAHQGCKAGDPLGDLIFSFLICKILRIIHHKLSTSKVCPTFHINSPDTIFGPARESIVNFSSINYADDNVFLAHSECPFEVLQSLEVIAATAIEEFARHGLKCSIGPKKTACMIKLTGKKHKSALNNLIKINKNVFLRVFTHVAGSIDIPVVKEYKHVGYFTVPSPVNNKDVFFRISQCKESMAAMGKRVLANPRIKTGTKQKFALIPVSKLLSNSSVWYNLSAKALCALDVTYNNVYRHVFNAKFGVSSCSAPMSNGQLYANHPFPNVLARIRARRLRQFARILAHAPRDLLDLLAHNCVFNNSFGAQLVEDLQWLFDSRSSCESFTLPPPNLPENYLVWHKFVSEQGDQFIKYVKQSEATDCIPLVLESPKVRNEALVQCPCCDRKMLAYKLDGHLAKVHKHRNPIKPYVAGSVCLFCMVDYQSRAKLVNHLCYHSPKCKNKYLSCVPKLSPEVFEEEERSTAQNAKALRQAGRSQLYSPYPAERVCGPLLPEFIRTRKKVGSYKKRSKA